MNPILHIVQPPKIPILQARCQCTTRYITSEFWYERMNKRSAQVAYRKLLVLSSVYFRSVPISRLRAWFGNSIVNQLLSDQLIDRAQRKARINPVGRQFMREHQIKSAGRAYLDTIDDFYVGAFYEGA